VYLSSRHLGLKLLHQLLAHHLSCFALGTQRAYRRAYTFLICTFHIQLVPIWCIREPCLLKRIIYGDHVDTLRGFSHGVSSPLLGNGRFVD
jgi:hypothetical protein